MVETDSNPGLTPKPMLLSLAPYGLARQRSGWCTGQAGSIDKGTEGHRLLLERRVCAGGGGSMAGQRGPYFQC